MAHNADPNLASTQGVTPLVYACKRGDPALVELFLKDKRIDVNLQSDTVHFLPLVWAAGKGFLHLVNILLDIKADVNLTENHGWLPLTHAIFKNQKHVVARLMEHPLIDLDKYDLENTTPLSVACEKGHLDIVKNLVEKGANANCRCEGKSLVQIAEDNQKKDVAFYLKKICEV